MYVFSNGREKIRLEEEAISEILVADTDSESGAAVSIVDLFEKRKKNNNSKPQQKSNHRLQ